MATTLFIGIPCYEANRRFRRTIKFFQQRTVLPHVLDAHVEKQSVVRNKNKLLERARESGARYVCFADDDVEPPYIWDRALISGMEVAQETLGIPIGQSGPRFIGPLGGGDGRWMDVLRAPGGNYTIRIHTSSSLPTPFCLAPALLGTLSVFSTDFLESMNWRLDDRYERSQWEDVDQSLSCRENGFSILYNDNVSVIHHFAQRSPRASSENLAKLLDKWQARPDLSMPQPRFLDLANVVLKAGYDSWPLATRLLYRSAWLAQRARASIRYRSRLALSVILGSGSSSRRT
jgi:hypothetical protein